MGMNGYGMQGFPDFGGGGYGGGYNQGGAFNPAMDAMRSQVNFATGGGFQNQLSNAMNQMMLMNLANQRASIDTRAIEAPIHQEQIRSDAIRDISDNRMSTLGPLLQALVGNIGGGTAFGNSGGGFTAVGADGQPFASATQGGSNAQPTNTQQYKTPQPKIQPRTPQTRFSPKFGGMNVSTGR